jgi:2-polyprenyl-6-hydroxyphenyl methylase/3-demethylubiquinone-9 3-methyltransferase
MSSVIDLADLRGERMLDAGCDTGWFALTAAELFGLIPVGIEVSPHAVAAARREGLEVHLGSVEHAPDIGKFSLITAIDVLEHTADPGAFMRSLEARLEPGGFLYLQTPNHQSSIYQLGRVLCNVAGGRPRGICERLFPSQHVQYFSRVGLNHLMDRCGLRIAKMETQILPASDLAVPRLLLVGLMTMQLVDYVRQTNILTCAVLQK